MCQIMRETFQNRALAFCRSVGSCAHYWKGHGDSGNGLRNVWPQKFSSSTVPPHAGATD